MNAVAQMCRRPQSRKLVSLAQPSLARSQRVHAGSLLPPYQQTLTSRVAPPLLLASTIQAKLTVNLPGDRCEREADQVADLVMRMPEPRLQREVEPEEGGTPPAKADHRSTGRSGFGRGADAGS
jgi:hypothetical protein